MDGNAGSENTLLVNTSDGRYVRYFAGLDRALMLTIAWTRGWTGGAIVGAWHTDYLRGLVACFGMLRCRYMFESDDSPMVDLVESGFPHSYMLARIASDRAEALTEHINSGGELSVAQYKLVFLDDLFKTGQVNPILLNRIACARYAEVVAKMDSTFDPRFMCGEPESIDVSAKRYRIQCAAFDPTVNVPVLCGMVFDYEGVDLTKALTNLKLVLRHEVAANVSITRLAERIDMSAPDIRPVAFTRAEIGPLYLPGFTGKEELPQIPGVDGNDILVSVTIDTTRAISSKKTSSLAVRFGVAPAIRQVYAVNVSDPICYDRGAEAVERILILPHRMMQHVSAASAKGSDFGYTYVTYTQQGEIQ